MDTITDPLPDIPRLRKAVEWVEEQAARPEKEREWEQRYYRAAPHDRDANVAMAWELINGQQKSCGSCFCVAGYIDQLDGEPSRYHQIHGSARELLGLTDGEASALFEATNSAAAVRSIAESIAARVGERL